MSALSMRVGLGCGFQRAYIFEPPGLVVRCTPHLGTGLRNASGAIHRRNSSIRIYEGPTGVLVEKTYHARFTARQEYDAYLALDDLLTASPAVRRPRIHGIDERSNAIHLEYVDGPNL